MADIHTDSAEKAFAAAAAEKAEKAEKVEVATKAEAPEPAPSQGELLASVAPVAVEPPVAIDPVVIVSQPEVAAEPAEAPLASVTDLKKIRKAPRVKTDKPVVTTPVVAPVKLAVVEPGAETGEAAPEGSEPETAKETTVADKTRKTADELTAKAREAVKEAQVRAKAAYEKNKDRLSDVGEFTKGNIEALREAGKILASGVKVLGKTYVEETKSGVATVRADVQELRAVVKSPKQFVKLQGTMMKKYFDNARATNSKQGEAVRKLGKEAFQPISNRVNLAIEKVKKAA